MSGTAVAAAGIVVAVAPAADGALFAAKASVARASQFLNDRHGTLLTFTVHNTGSSASIGAVQIARPSNFWTVTVCPSAPAGWKTDRTASWCRYISANRKGDDLKPGASSSHFAVRATTRAAGSNRQGTWRVTVAKSNDLDSGGGVSSAGSQAPGLRTTAYAWQVTDAIVRTTAKSPGTACPARQRTAVAGSTGHVIVICGRNRATTALTPALARSSVRGTFLASHGAFATGRIPAKSGLVVLGSWTQVTVSAKAGSGKTVTAAIASSAHATSPRTTLTGYVINAPPHAVSVTPATSVEAAKDGQSATFVEHVTNKGTLSDTFTLSTAGGAWSATVYDASCITPLSTTPNVAAGDAIDVCVKVDVPADATEAATQGTTLTATSTAAPAVKASAALTTMAVQFDTLVVDGDTNSPTDSAPYYQVALDANGIDYGGWDLLTDPAIPVSYLAAHVNVVWFTGNSGSGPITPYAGELKTLLDGGGRLFLSGPDILDGAAGTTAFVHDYLHVDWDGSEVQNDKSTNAVHSVSGNAVTDGIGSVPIAHSVLNSTTEDRITPIAPATAAFTDDNPDTDALIVADADYKVVFLAFPFEAYGSAAQKADLVNRVMTWLDA